MVAIKGMKSPLPQLQKQTNFCTYSPRSSTESQPLQEDNLEVDRSGQGAQYQRNSEITFQSLTLLDNRLQTDPGDKRSKFAREILQSERQYVQMLEIVKDVYAAPLKAALSSNRAILSIANVQIIFSDILNVLQVNKQLLRELTERLQEWGPAQCLGDVFVKFSSHLKIYTNFFNNYTVILKTIDKVNFSTDLSP
ncbi:unnamed protein product [Ranitomeya imitator]|uniref:DH domain-containing protein n=1 Tax=Ranitomeya imitator TaxID=111125 RepID=A0ABN9LA72_9NEOB|nr:unnamed protein product [Ranitomeya imitator]